jgi:hypothetical protein
MIVLEYESAYPANLLESGQVKLRIRKRVQRNDERGVCQRRIRLEILDDLGKKICGRTIRLV